MKILHIIVCLDIGGAELMLKRLIEGHQENPNFDHSVISLTNIGQVGIQLEEMGVRVLALGMKSPLQVPRVIWRLIKSIRLCRPDIVQTWMYHADFLGGLASKFTGVPKLIWGIRTTDVSSGCSFSTRILRRFCALLSYSLPNKIVCVAQASKKVHVSIGYDPLRMEVVPNGFDIPKTESLQKHRSLLRDQFGFEDQCVIGSVGRFNLDKDQENFIKAASILSKQYENLRFLMVGRDLDASNSALARWITESDCADRFVLLGERSDIPACLSAIDIFCLHSRTEGFPNVLGEAMAAGLPCVTTDVGDARLLLNDDRFAVPKENPLALAQGVSELLSLSPDERVVVGDQSRLRIEKYFSLKLVRERFECVYSAVLNESMV